MAELKQLAAELRGYRVEQRALDEAADILQRAAELPNGALFQRIEAIQQSQVLGSDAFNQCSELKAELIAFTIGAVARLKGGA